ncbi:MAG: DUF2059 domain-containing protein [Marinobacter sp.]|nr:DUF2059 domain-containing protein [Marinobacter sp.]
MPRVHTFHPVLFAWFAFALALLPLRVSATPLAEAVVKASALDRIIDQYPAMMSEGISEGMRQGGLREPMLLNAITGIVSQAFSASAIRRQVVNDLSNKVPKADLEQVLAWYETPLGRKVGGLEASASNPEAWRKIEQQSNALTNRYQGTPRANMFAAFDRAARATESATDTAIAVQLSMISAMAAFDPQARANMAQIKQQVRSQRFMIEGVVEQQVYAAYLYTYQGMSDEELQGYLQFLQTDHGQRYTRVITESIQQAILVPVESIGQQMFRLFNRQG